MRTIDNATKRWLIEFSNRLRKIPVAIEENGNLGKNLRQFLECVKRTLNDIEEAATKLSFISTAAEFARFTELSTNVKKGFEDVMLKREALIRKQTGKRKALYFLSLLELKSPVSHLAAYLSGLPIYGKKDTPMTEEAFARKCGRGKRTIINWLNGKGTPTVYFPDLGKYVTFSRELLNNPIEAEKFAMLFKEQERIKRGVRNKVSHNGEATDMANERQKRGIPKSRTNREEEDAEEIGHLTGYGGSSWYGHQ